MIVLVTGGRKYRNRAYVWHVLDRIHARRPITQLVEGGATGADEHARAWAKSIGLEPTTCDADWQRYQGHAGRVRNCAMLREHRPQLVVAFPGNAGTRHMKRIATEARVLVYDAAKYERVTQQ